MNSTLSPEMNDRAREAAKRLIAKFGGIAAHAARAIDRSAGSFSRFMQGKEGLSYAAAALIARELGEDLNEMLGIAAPAAATNIGNLPGFRKALKEVQAVVPQYSEELWERVGEMVLQPHPAAVDTMFLLRMAEIAQSMSVKALTSGSDTAPPSRPGGHKPSGRKIRTR